MTKRKALSKIFSVLLTAAMIAGLISAVPISAEGSNKSISIPKASVTPIYQVPGIGSFLTEGVWDSVPFNSISNTITGSGSTSARFQMMYDSTNTIYINMEITDSTNYKGTEKFELVFNFNKAGSAYDNSLFGTFVGNMDNWFHSISQAGSMTISSGTVCDAYYQSGKYYVIYAVRPNVPSSCFEDGASFQFDFRYIDATNGTQGWGSGSQMIAWSAVTPAGVDGGASTELGTVRFPYTNQVADIQKAPLIGEIFVVQDGKTIKGDAWNNISTQVVSRAAKGSASTTNGTLQMMYNDSSLYFYVEMADSTPKSSDSFEFVIDLNEMAQDETGYTYNLLGTFSGNADGWAPGNPIASQGGDLVLKSSQYAVTYDSNTGKYICCFKAELKDTVKSVIAKDNSIRVDFRYYDGVSDSDLWRNGTNVIAWSTASLAAISPSNASELGTITFKVPTINLTDITILKAPEGKSILVPDEAAGKTYKGDAFKGIQSIPLSNTPKGTGAASGEFWSVYDSSAVYFWIEVKDDVPLSQDTFEVVLDLNTAAQYAAGYNWDLLGTYAGNADNWAPGDPIGSQGGNMVLKSSFFAVNYNQDTHKYSACFKIGLPDSAVLSQGNSIKADVRFYDAVSASDGFRNGTNVLAWSTKTQSAISPDSLTEMGTLTFGSVNNYASTGISNYNYYGDITLSGFTDNNYDWGHSVIKVGNKFKMWWVHGAPDKIYYAESSDCLTWTNVQVVMESQIGSSTITSGQVTADDYELFHVGSPSVVFVDGTYYMFYEAPQYVSSDLLTEMYNNIFVATSTDGITWNKNLVNGTSTPVIKIPQSKITELNGTYKYGIGQPKVMYKDGAFEIYYTSDLAGNNAIYTATSADGYNWYNKTGSSNVLDHDRLLAGNTLDVKYSIELQKYVMTFSVSNRYMTDSQAGEAFNYGVFYISSSDRYDWGTGSIFTEASKANNVMQGVTDRQTRAFPYFITNSEGLIESETFHIMFLAGDIHNESSDWRTKASTWDGALVSFNPQEYTASTLLTPAQSYDGTHADIEGDVNFDGVADILDIIKVRNAVIGKETLTDKEFAKANINSVNSIIDIIDILMIKSIVLGQ